MWIRPTARFGSSPRAWGILKDALQLNILDRFIPTCVGNTCWAKVSRATGPVHPHVRGEYASTTSGRHSSAGSSPRAWGIPRRGRWPPRQSRFIPTCVGNTRRCRRRSCPRTVHPHVRGEYQGIKAGSYGADGSSPRAWGIPRPGRGHLGHGRFIPTCVGNTATPGDELLVATVHPHVRGEYAIWTAWSSRPAGSSPRAWGIHKGGGLMHTGTRFIPTCVGNTSMR